MASRCTWILTKRIGSFKGGLTRIQFRNNSTTRTEHWEEVLAGDSKSGEDVPARPASSGGSGVPHTYSRDNPLGCRNLLHAGLTKLDQFPQTHSGLAIEPLRASVRVWIVELESCKGPVVKSRIPRIKSHGSARKED